MNDYLINVLGKWKGGEDSDPHFNNLYQNKF